MRKLFCLLIVSALTCLVSFSSVRAQKKADSNERGWGLALGALLLPHPKLKYEATSIGDIEFSCRTYGGSLSAFFIGRKSLLGWRPLWQGEAGLSWLHESGHGRMTVQGYPATAESDVREFGVRLSLVANYLKTSKIWIGSGLESCQVLIVGGAREDFSISVQREGQDIEVFRPGREESLADSRGIILLSAKIFDKVWNSWELQFGYWRTTVGRSNSYGNYGLDEGGAYTEINGWYFKIRKLFLFKLRK
ncbi:MAG: hypothetical protein JSV10_03740 [Candidatus Zixiibacteriota bacterium]|nr:MAG: hypothetical protein JSV10_03740 [candidate division Zixibacteria bacterium]